MVALYNSQVCGQAGKNNKIIVTRAQESIAERHLRTKGIDEGSGKELPNCVKGEEPCKPRRSKDTGNANEIVRKPNKVSILG